MTDRGPDTEELLRRVEAGDPVARDALLHRHRARLRQSVALRMDPRLAARVDASDVVQETLAEADRRMGDYLRERPLPFYPWLRRLALDRLAEQRRFHVRAARRSVSREELPPLRLPDGSALELANRLLARSGGPSEAARRKELVGQVRAALDALSPQEREVVELRYLEQLTAREVAAILGVSEAAAKKRALRALQRLRDLLEQSASGGGR